MQVSATVYSQTTKFSFNIQSRQVVDVLKEIEENKKRGEAVLQLDDILPENNSMQQIVSMSALLEENNLDGIAQMYGFDGDAD